MSTSVMPAVQMLSMEFNKTYGTCTILEKILAVIEKRAKAL
jgi:hypothetical protein